MAIDSNAKKLSLITMGVPWYVAGPLIDGSFDEDEFRILLHLYFGFDSVPIDEVISTKIYLISVWDNVECAAGAQLLSHIVGYANAIQNVSLSTDEQLTLSAPRFEPETESVEWGWISNLVMGNVIRVYDPLTEDVLEWRIHDVVKRQDERGLATVTVRADPILLDLKKFLVAHEVTGSLTYRNLGVVDLTPQQIIDTFVLDMDDNPSWIVRGTVTPTEEVELAWEGFTALELLRDLAEKFPDYELRLRRNGSTDYQIDIAATGSGIVGPPVQFGRNLLSLTEREWTNNFATVLVPRGRMPQGALELGTIGDNVWKITAKAGGDLTLADPADGDPPIAMDDQLNGLYLESATETTREEITASVAATGVVTVADATDFAIGDQCRISKDSSGTLLSELTYPASIGTYGRIIGTLDFPDQPTSRNYHPPGAMHQTNGWGDLDIKYLACQVDGAHGGVTTLNIQGLPANLVIPAGSFISQCDNPLFVANSSTELFDFEITVGDTADSGGDATVTIDANITASDGDYLVLANGVNLDGIVDEWPTIDDSGSDLCALGSNLDDKTEHGDVHAGSYPWPTGTGNDFPSDIVGTLASAVGVGDRRIDVTGLAPNTYYPNIYENFFYDDDTVTERTTAVAVGFQTNGSGAATIEVVGTMSFSASPGNDCRLIAPPPTPSGWDAKKSDYVLLGILTGPSHYLRFQGVPVRYVPGQSTLYVGHGVTFYGSDIGPYSQAVTPSLMPKMILNTRLLGSGDSFDSNTFYASDADISPATRTLLHHDYTGSLVIGEDKEVNVQVYSYHWNTGGHKLFTWPDVKVIQAFRYFSMWLGPESDPPITPGSLANVLWQQTNARFSEVGTPEVQYSMTLRDLSSLPGFEASAEKPVLGSVVPILDEKSGLSIDARIVAITFDLVDRMNSRIFLEKTITLATKNMLNPRFTVRRPEANQSTELSGPEARPAVREDGAFRSSAPSDTAGGIVTPEEYEA